MTWGREPSDPQYSIPTIRRNNPRDPVRLRWNAMLDTGNNAIPSSGQTRFEHRDGRLWYFTASIVRDTLRGFDELQEELTNLDLTHYVVGTSGGCEPVRFVAAGLHEAKQVTQRFANMPLDLYRVITADAEPTGDHPLKGFVAQITIRQEHRVQRSLAKHDYDIEYDVEERVGRVNDGIVVLFPTQAEINRALDTVTNRETHVLEQLIERLGMATDEQRRNLPSDEVRPFSETRVNTNTSRPRREFSEVTAAFDDVCMPPGREERAIQL